MKPDEVLTLAAGAARFRRVRLSGHALDQMHERNVQIADVYQSLQTAKEARWQEDHGTWKLVGGLDMDGDELVLAVAIRDHDVKVVTVFGR